MPELISEITLGRRVGRLDANTIRLHEVAYDPYTELPPHAHARSSVSIILHGDCEDRVDGHVEKPGALTVMVKPAGRVHYTRCGPTGYHSVIMEVPRRLEAYLRSHTTLLTACHWAPSESAVALMLQLYSAARSGRTFPDRWIEAWVRSLQRVVVQKPTPDHHGPGRVADAMCIMRRDFRAPLSVSVIANELGIHPVHLARLFRAQTGATIKNHLRRLRVRYVANRLATVDAPVGRIAAEAGFADHAHLCRDFRRHTQMTPSEYRELAAAVVRR